jgi:hypothetical protein
MDLRLRDLVDPWGQDRIELTCTARLHTVLLNQFFRKATSLFCLVLLRFVSQKLLIFDKDNKNA